MSSEAITRNDLENILNELLPARVDYVVDYGTSGDWTYRKWSSGVAECWCHLTHMATGATAWGSVYYTTPNATATYPSGLFIEEPAVNVYHVGAGVQGMACTSSADATKVVFYLIRGTSATGSLRFNIYAIGKWK